MNADAGVLAGLKVIDCATYVAGPASATIMSDFGADVIKVERTPDGDLWRTFPETPGYPKSDLSYTWVLTNRNKRSIVLDLSKPTGRDVLLRLVGGADVFVTNYQSSLLRKFRLEWEDLSAANPRLIYANVTGYGDRGADADAPAYDTLAYFARSGLMIGSDNKTILPRPAMGDQATAVTLFAAIMLGLYRRDRTGLGSRVSTSLMAAGAWANGFELQARFCGAEFPKRSPGDRPVNPFIASYASADGQAMFIILLDPEREFLRLCKALDAPELAVSPLFATLEARKENAGDLYAILQSQFETRPLSEWRGRFREYDIKWSHLPTLEEASRDPQMRDCGAIVDFQYPGRGTIETVDSPIHVAGSEKQKPRIPPEFGAHTRTILKEAGYSDAEVERMIQAGLAVAASEPHSGR